MDIFKNFSDLLTLNSGDRKISSHFCFSFTIISFKLWADPIILNDLGKLKFPI